MPRSALLCLAAVAFAPGTAFAAPGAQPEVSLRFSAPSSPLAGVSFGLAAIDSRPLILAERTSVRLGAGYRLIAYTCPGDSRAAPDRTIGFDFEPGRDYELVCRAGQAASIRAIEDRC